MCIRDRDIVENFGHEDENDEGLDSDDEDDLKEIELSPKHPLYQIQNQLEENYNWLRSQLESLFAELTGPSNPEEEDEEEEGATTKDPRVTLYRPVARKLGQLYLKASEEPSQVFTTLTYEDDVPEEINGLTAKKAQEAALKLTSEAIKYFEKANDRNDPQTWVDVAAVSYTHLDVYKRQLFKRSAMIWISAAQSLGSLKTKTASNGLESNPLISLESSCNLASLTAENGVISLLYLTISAECTTSLKPYLSATSLTLGMPTASTFSYLEVKVLYGVWL